MKEYNNLDYILDQQSDEEEIKEIIDELENMSLEDFKLSGYTYIDDFNGDDLYISFYYRQQCYGFVKIEYEPDDPFDVWEEDTYDEEFIELKELAIDALKEEL